MRTLNLNDAVSEIRQAVLEAKKRNRPSPFFFKVGAGISFPPIPLADEIQANCVRIAAEYGRKTESQSMDSAQSYSHCFERAYPQPEQRQQYLRDLMENAFISRANFKLAHLLLDETVTNLVHTTNFDDLLSRALTVFGKRHVV